MRAEGRSQRLLRGWRGADVSVVEGDETDQTNVWLGKRLPAGIIEPVSSNRGEGLRCRRLIRCEKSGRWRRWGEAGRDDWGFRN